MAEAKAQGNSDEAIEKAFDEQTSDYLEAETSIIFRRDDTLRKVPRPPPSTPPPKPTPKWRQILGSVAIPLVILFFLSSLIVGGVTVLGWLFYWLIALINGRAFG